LSFVKGIRCYIIAGLKYHELYENLKAELSKNNYTMKKSFILLLVMAIFWSCQPKQQEEAVDTGEFKYFSEQFADLKIIRYQIPGFEQLSLEQKKLVYYLTQAGLSGRDIIWDQNYRHNLKIRRALEKIVNDYEGDRTTAEWNNFMTYTKRVWFSSGIHHHYGNNKFIPTFSREYFTSLINESDAELNKEIIEVMFDNSIDNKKVNLDESKGLLLGSAINFYGPDVTADEVDNFYGNLKIEGDTEPISYGLNSKLDRADDGSLIEKVWKVGGMYGPAIEKIVYWLEKAATVAENEKQKEGFNLLIEYYKTGDLKVWDAYNIVWASSTEGDIDYINGFVEVYYDPIAYRGYYESIIEITDFEASKRMATLTDNVQWFEDNSTIMDEHKKKDVVGVTYKVVTVAGEAGGTSPSSPIGVNLPNANWIRASIGSKSVSLGNIVEAYSEAGTKGMLEEFYFSEELISRTKEHGGLAGKLHTAMHEVIGHASGQINEGVGTPKETLKSYRSALEEGRADLVALYFLMDQKLVDLGLTPSLEVGMSEYDSYINNGLLTQLRRIEPGADIEESHMRNRQLVAGWVYEKGRENNVIERVEKDGKTYFIINDYVQLRELFGQLLRELQRVKSEGDYEAGKNLIETYGVKVDQELHAEVLERFKALNAAAYGGFINPVLVPVEDENGEITDVKVEYPSDFTMQMLYYAKNYSFLPDEN
jgi:dipeptidyl-peptidase-3